MENQKVNQSFELYSTGVKNVLIEQMNYSRKEVDYIMDGYQPVIERIGYFENPAEWAEKIDLAMKRNITPEMWMFTLK